MKRRDCFRLAGAAGAAALLSSGCSRVVQRVSRPFPETPPVPLPKTGDIPTAARLLNRAGFGPTPGDVATVTKTGIEAYVKAQLNAPIETMRYGSNPLEVAFDKRNYVGDGTERNELYFRLRGLEVVRAASPFELRDMREEEVLAQMSQAALLRAAYSEWQLRERMVDFWSNHFNIYGPKLINTHQKDGIDYGKTHLSYYKAIDDLKVVRQHALGKFPDLIKASAHSPAMLGYLDNNVNAKGVANENYAREILELHTLGIGGGYSQKDVQEVARCLTGWTVQEGFLAKRGTFQFDLTKHDDGEKIVLGTKIPAKGGETDGNRVIDIITSHPSCARFISKKLVRYFLGHEDETWIATLSSIYQKTGGDIKAMLEPMLLSPDLLSSPPILKRPFDYVVSALRATGADTNGEKPIQDYLAAMGQPLNQWPMPDGYPDKTAAWTGSLLARWNFASAFTDGQIKGTSATLKAGPLDDRIEMVLAQKASDPALADLKTALKGMTKVSEITALLLASPAFQWR